MSNRPAVAAIGALGVAVAIVLGWWVSRSPQSPGDTELTDIAPPSDTGGVVLEADEVYSEAEAIDLSGLPTTDWVAPYDPTRAASGYTLLFFRRRVPMIVDMNGRIVHSWPSLRVASRMHLTDHGSLVYIGDDGSLREADWEGNLLWSFDQPHPEYFPHHDLLRLADGSTLAPYRDMAKHTDDLLRVDSQGAVVWSWSSEEHLATWLAESTLKKSDLTHINSVQVLPENAWHDGGDERFTPGYLLFSARHLDRIFVIDPVSGAVTWDWGEGLDHQHEARMIPPGQPGAGNILVFDNRLHDPAKRTRILEIAPPSGEVVWSYDDPGFFSASGGVEQPLPNGNLLVTSSEGGRIFEITREGEIVWQWVAPFVPMRALRLDYDHCPQLTALGRPDEVAIPAPEHPVVDRSLRQFASREDLTRARVGGEAVVVLRERSLCKTLSVPRGTTVELGYGFEARRAAWARGLDLGGTVKLTLVDPATEEEVVLHEDAIDLPSSRPWTEHSIAVPQVHHGQTRTVCLTSAETGSAAGTVPRGGFVVGPPHFTAPTSRDGAVRLPEVTPSKAAAEELTRMQLEALGYAD